jgi:hypothetical protein
MGSQDELTAIQGGTATITLQNRDRRFEPAFAASPYYPFITPMRPVRIRATWNAVTYNIFNGFIAEWPQDWSHSPHDQETTVMCVDGFEPLNQTLLTTSFAQELSGVRIAEVLTAMGWNSTATALDAGKSTIQASALAQTSALQHIQDIANSELGQFFMSTDGKATFHDRSRRQTTVSSSATFGDTASDIPYESIAVSFTKDSIRNDAQVTREGGTVQEAADIASETAYFTRTWTASPLYTTDAEALNMASWIVANYKNPALRIDSVALRPTLQPSTVWPQALGRAISDRITTIRRPPAGGASIQSDSFINGVAHNVQMGSHGWEWRTVFSLTPTALYAGWVLDTSALDTGAILAF